MSLFKQWIRQHEDIAVEVRRAIVRHMQPLLLQHLQVSSLHLALYLHPGLILYIDGIVVQLREHIWGCLIQRIQDKDPQVRRGAVMAVCETAMVSVCHACFAFCYRGGV